MTIHDPDPTHLRDVLDASFGDGPAQASPAERLAAGRTALRRRRGAGVVGSVAALAVVLGGVAMLGPGGSGPETAEPVAPPPSVAPSKGTIDETQLEASLDELARDARRRPLVEVTAGDEVVAGPGWTLDQVEPIRVRVAGGPTPPGDRIVQVSRDGEVRYVVVVGHWPAAELVTVEGKVPPTSMLAALLTYLTQPGRSGDGAR